MSWAKGIIMSASEIVNKVWNYAHVLRDDGVGYGDYVEQITYLIFLKMADERQKAGQETKVPKKYTWAELVKLDGDDLVDVAKLSLATPKTERIVKQAESLFKLMSAEVPDFDHFTPSNWLIKNLDALDGEGEELMGTLEIAESVFKAINSLLDLNQGASQLKN